MMSRQLACNSSKVISQDYQNYPGIYNVQFRNRFESQFRNRVRVQSSQSFIPKFKEVIIAALLILPYWMVNL